MRLINTKLIYSLKKFKERYKNCYCKVLFNYESWMITVTRNIKLFDFRKKRGKYF